MGPSPVGMRDPTGPVTPRRTDMFLGCYQDLRMDSPSLSHSSPDEVVGLPSFWRLPVQWAGTEEWRLAAFEATKDPPPGKQPPLRWVYCI